MKKVLVVLAEGFEEIEAVTPIDVLRRAGCEVVVAGVTGKTAAGGTPGFFVTGAHGIAISADAQIESIHDVPDAVVLPGGMPGADNLKKSKAVTALLKKIQAKDGIIAAICASPAVVLAPQGFLDKKKFTCYPGFETGLSSLKSTEMSSPHALGGDQHAGPRQMKAGTTGSCITFVDRPVVWDGNILTSKGPGTALEFSLALVERLAGPEKAKQLKEGMLL